MNHWLENANLKRLMKKYPIGCRVEVRWKIGIKWETTFKGTVKGYEIFAGKACLDLITGRLCTTYVNEHEIVRILQEAGKDDK